MEELRSSEVNLATSNQQLLDQIHERDLAQASLSRSVEELRASEASLSRSVEELRSSEDNLATSNQQLIEEVRERDLAQANLSSSVEELRASEASLSLSVEELRSSESNLAVSNQQLIEEVRERDLAQANLSRSIEELRASEASLSLSVEELRSSEANLATSNQQLLEEVRQRDLAQANLSRSVEELRRSNAQLDSFAYGASHDLKAPLRGISNLAEWITEDVKDTAGPDTLRNLQLLLSRVARLDMLLDALLQYSRVGRGGRAPEDVDIGALVGDIADYIAPPDGFTVKFEGAAPPMHVDKAPLEQVLRNLINNAIKHHDRPAGSVVVTSRQVGDLVEVRVEDDGGGIKGAFHERIFEMFQTLQSRDTLEGSGMGLAIVKKSVEDHGGAIKVESEPPGRGTVFVFTWEKDEMPMAA